MLDDLLDLLGFAAADVIVGESSKRYRFVRILKGIAWALLLGAIGMAIFLTAKYS